MVGNEVKNFVVKIFSREFFNWLIIDIVGFWFLFLVFLFSCYFVSAKTFSFFGDCLQVLGIVFVVLGVNSKLEKLKYPGITASIVNWFRACPLRSKSVILNVDSATIRTTMGGAFIEAQNKLPDSYTLDDVVKYFNIEIQNLDARNKSRFSNNEKSIKEIKEGIDEIKKDHSDFKARTEKTFIDLHIRDFEKELFGACAIILGLWYSITALFLK